jgi:hypothetical protein
MPLLFSPVDQTELRGPFKPRPRSAFLMLQIGEPISNQEMAIQKQVRAELRARKIEVITAGDVPGTGDYLKKIIDLIRGSGFGIAIFSDLTPARTLANIFFELGVAAILGKPVQLLIAGAAPAPSDFVRTEWLRYDQSHKAKFAANLKRSLGMIVDGAEYYQKVGKIALQADEPDLEEAFERFKQAILIGGNAAAKAGLGELQKRLQQAGRSQTFERSALASHRSRLLKAISEFLALLPNPKRPSPRMKRKRSG